MYKRQTELGGWIAPVVQHNLAYLKGLLEDVEGKWFDPHTGECTRNYQIFLACVTSFKEKFKRRHREIENMVQDAGTHRSVTLFQEHSEDD